MYPYTPADYFNIDNLLTDEHKIIRTSIRNWMNKSVVPVIEKAAQDHHFPVHLMQELGEIGTLVPFIPVEFGGAGLDHISNGVIMTELEEAIREYDPQLRFNLRW